MYVQEQCQQPKKNQQKVQILNKTTLYVGPTEESWKMDLSMIPKDSTVNDGLHHINIKLWVKI